MKIYKIVYVKDDFIDLFEEYDKILPILYHDHESTYHNKQIDMIFDLIDNKKHLLDNYLNKRNDYTYEKNFYSIHNIITDQYIHIKINKYDLEVYEEDNGTIIFDYLKIFKKNFYMFSL